MKATRVCLVVLAILPNLGILGKTIPTEDFSLKDDFPVVEIADGKIIGTKNVTVGKKTSFEAFRGIPFAEPPLGQLRFAAPVKNSKWKGFWDATEEAQKCVQGSGDNIRGSEDCLYINVYRPKKAKNLPVMVWIYGGAFTGGSSLYRAFGPDHLLDQGVVFVSFNYRLGIFGFLSTEDTVASGNWGLKDQVLALQWVKDNIKYFGGNPDQITIFGESAGGASVSYLMQIPQAKGLFSGAIMQSGNSENLWALTTRARQTAFQVGYNLGIPAVLSRTLVSRLREIDAYRLQKTSTSVSRQVMILNPLRGLTYAPVIEVEHAGAVFTQKSDDHFRSGEYPNKVPVLIGYNSNEAGSAHGLSETLKSYLLLFDANPNILAPFSLTSSKSLTNLAAAEVKTRYFGFNTIRSQFNAVVQFINDDQFIRGTRRFAENIAQYAPTYFYVFGYEGNAVGENSYNGVGHGEDLVYLFRHDKNTWSAKDLEVRDKLVKLWTNFAKYGNPTPKKQTLLNNFIWKPVDPKSDNFDYAVLNYTLSAGTNPAQDVWEFYNGIFNDFGENSFTTY